MEPYSLSLFDNPAPRDAELEEKRRKGKLTLVRPLSYVVIDIETTGLDVARSAIIEIGAVHVRNGAVSGRFQTFPDPGTVPEPVTFYYEPDGHYGQRPCWGTDL